MHCYDSAKQTLRALGSYSQPLDPPPSRCVDDMWVIPGQITEYFVGPMLFGLGFYQRFYSHINGQIESLSAVVQVVSEIWPFYCVWYASHFARNLQPSYFGL